MAVCSNDFGLSVLTMKMSSDLDWSCDGGKNLRPQSDLRSESHDGKEMLVHLRPSC